MVLFSHWYSMRMYLPATARVAASLLVGTELAVVHKVAVMSAAGTDTVVHPLDMFPVAALLGILPGRADTVVGRPPAACGWPW